MAFLFGTDAVSEVMKPRPKAAYVDWLAAVPVEDQYASAATVAELFEGAHRLADPGKTLDRIRGVVLPRVHVLAFDADVAEVFGRIAGELSRAGQRIADMDLMIAATALHHDLELVTGNVRHFERVPGLKICRALIDAR